MKLSNKKAKELGKKVLDQAVGLQPEVTSYVEAIQYNTKGNFYEAVVKVNFVAQTDMGSVAVDRSVTVPLNTISDVKIADHVIEANSPAPKEEKKKRGGKKPKNLDESAPEGEEQPVEDVEQFNEE